MEKEYDTMLILEIFVISWHFRIDNEQRKEFYIFYHLCRVERIWGNCSGCLFFYSVIIQVPRVTFAPKLSKLSFPLSKKVSPWVANNLVRWNLNFSIWLNSFLEGKITNNQHDPNSQFIQEIPSLCLFDPTSCPISLPFSIRGVSVCVNQQIFFSIFPNNS